jgi:carboxyl-terminal processing protease
VLLQLLESDIIAAYYYQAGAIEAGLNYDRQLKEAERLLKNPEEYQKILAPQKPKETSSLIKLDKKPIGNISQTEKHIPQPSSKPLFMLA